MSKIYKSLKNSSLFLNLFSVGSATVVSKLISLLIIGYPARILGPKNFGIIGFGSSLAAYAGILLIPGITTWGTRNIARNRNAFSETLVVVNMIRFILAIVAYGLLLSYAFCALDNHLERTVVLLSGTAVFTTAVTVDWVFNGLELMRIPAMVGIFSTIVNVVALVSLIRSPADVYIYALFAPSLSLLTSVISFFFLVKKGVRLHIPKFRCFRDSLKAAISLGITMSLVVILHYANNLIVKFFLGSTALGIFMSAFFLIELASTLPTILASIFLARLSRHVAESIDLAKRDARIFAQVHMIIAFLVASIFFIEAPGIILFLFGNKYLQAGELLRYMSVALIFNFAIFGYTNCLISFGYDRVMLLVVTVSAIVSIGGGFILVPRFGEIGASIVVIFIDLCGWLVSLPYYKKAVGSLHLKTWILPALGAITVIVVSSALQYIGISFFIRIGASLVVYGLYVYRAIYNTFREYI